MGSFLQYMLIFHCLFWHFYVWRNGVACSIFYVLLMFILHSRESKLYRSLLDGMSALAWEFPFPKCLYSTWRWDRPVKCLAQGHNKRTCGFVLHNLAKSRAPSCEYDFLKFFNGSTRGMKPRSTDCEADALNAMPSRQCEFLYRFV